jgi:hypothetical protein
MARTRWPSDLGTPASDPGQADQTGSAGGCQKNLGPADRSFRKTTRRRRQPNRRSGRDPGPRPYAHTTSKPGKPGRKHYPHPPCRVCIPPMQLPGKPVRRAYWPSYACPGPGTSLGVSRQLPGPRRACWPSDSSDTTSPAGRGTPAGRCAARESRKPKLAFDADQPTR